MNIKSFLRKSWNEGTEIGKQNCFATAIIGSSAHFIFPFIFKFGFGIYENFFLRMAAALLCASIFNLYKKKSITTSIYWHGVFIYVLPFIFTVNLLKSNFNELWLYWEIFMIFVLISYIPNWFMFLTDLLIGIGMAVLYYSFTPNLAPLIINFNITLYSAVIVCSAFVGSIFTYHNKMTSLNKLKEQHKKLTALAGSIVHEVRNPLNVIRFAQSQINNVLLKNEGERSKDLFDLLSSINDATEQANKIINIVLSDLSGKPIDPDSFVVLNVNLAIKEAVEKFGYNSELERSKVRMVLGEDALLFYNSSAVFASNFGANIVSDSGSNFSFKAIADRFNFIIYNLLKNALYYLKEYPNSVITIGTQLRNFSGKDYNVVYVHDTGPGIPPHILNNLFNDFFTSGKSDGTGLGLAFCKKNMLAFGGDIIAESNFIDHKNNKQKTNQGPNQGQLQSQNDDYNLHSSWTKFSLLFPKLSQSEIELAGLSKVAKQKILLVDDKEINLITTKAKIENALSLITCDVAMGGKQAIEMVEKNEYKLILMDMQMPEMSGAEAGRIIRNNNQNVPIVALTSLSHQDFLEELKQECDKNIDHHKNLQISQKIFNCYLSKSETDNIFYRGIAKWIKAANDDLPYVKKDDQYLKGLKNKRILLADDQAINRLMIKRILEENGSNLVEAQDGKELLEIYQKSLDAKGKSDFDLIITDINMPPYSGDEAAKEIRKIESQNHIAHQNKMPIIALSGDGEQQNICHFFSCQMTDYFVKGTNPENLLKTIVVYLNGNLESHKTKTEQTIKIDLKQPEKFSNLKEKIGPEKSEMVKEQ